VAAGKPRRASGVKGGVVAKWDEHTDEHGCKYATALNFATGGGECDRQTSMHTVERRQRASSFAAASGSW
jgi:hypothetical protein